MCIDTCIDVTLVDWCPCGNGLLVDLFYDAFKELGDPADGILRGARVSW